MRVLTFVWSLRIEWNIFRFVYEMFADAVDLGVVVLSDRPMLFEGSFVTWI